MGNSASIQSAKEGRELPVPGNHPTPEASKANGWENVAGESSHLGWGSSSGSTGGNDQGWADKSTETQYNGWGERATVSKDIARKCSSSKPKPPEMCSSGWMDGPTREEYRGWVSEPARREFNGWMDDPVDDEYNGWGMLHSMHTNNPIEDTQISDSVKPLSHSSNDNPTLVPVTPSAPPLPEQVLPEGLGHFPSDSIPVGMAVPSEMHEASRTNDAGKENSSSLCIICWEAPVDGACVPCGHMAGCMPCLSEIKSKKGECPVCRAKMDQIIKLYAV